MVLAKSAQQLLPSATHKTLFNTGAGFSLPAIISSAQRLRLATAYMNPMGLTQLHLWKTKCQDLEVLVGGTKLFDTHPDALRELLALKARMRVDARLCDLAGKGVFHPKVLLVEGPAGLSAILGSSNCTGGGYQSNLEANVLLQQPAVVDQLRRWFDSIIDGDQAGVIAKRLTFPFIKAYEKNWKKAQAKKREIAQLASRQKKAVAKGTALENRAWKDLVREARRWHSDVARDARETTKAVAEMLRALDYPSFARLDKERWRRFFAVPDLGKLNALYRDRMIRKPKRLRAALRGLVAEDRELGNRLDAFLRTEGAGPNIATKILTIHDRNRYATWNAPVEDTLREFGVEFPRGVSFGRKYVDFQHQIQNLAKEAGYKNMLEVDVFLYQYWGAEE